MPPKKKKSGSSLTGGGKSDPITTVRGRVLAYYTTAANVVAIGLNPLSLDQRLVDISDDFQEFRFTHLNIRAFSDVAFNPNTAKWLIMAAYTPVILTSTPSYTQLVSLPLYKVGTGEFGNPWPNLRVGREELGANQPKWFRRGSAYDDLLETQGQIYIGSDTGFNSKAMYVFIEYTIELKGMAEAGLTDVGQNLVPIEKLVTELAANAGMVPKDAEEEETTVVITSPRAPKPPSRLEQLRASERRPRTADPTAASSAASTASSVARAGV